MSSKFRRGQVWYRDDGCDDKYNQTTNIQKGGRPVLIFSSDKGNNSSYLVSVIPLTKEHKPELNINVKFRSYDNVLNTALCNQLCPCDTYELKKYLYTISEEDMTRIERGVMYANGLDKYINNVEARCTYDQLKDVIEGIVTARVEEIVKDRMK